MSEGMTPPRENKMGVMPVTRLLVTMSLPMIFSMLVQALYNIVDGKFVSEFSEQAFTAVSLSFPVQNLMIGVSTGTGVGVNALLSKSLGEKRFDIANRTANNSIFLAAAGYVVFALFGLFFSRTYFSAITDIPAIIEYGTTYLSICTIFSFGIFCQIAFEKLLQSTGKTFYTMITQCIGAVINIVLDPILILGLFGFPQLGVAGAAIATVLGQIVGAVCTVIFNQVKNHEIKLSFREMKPDRWIVKRIYAVGVPSIVMASVGSVMNFFMNKILMAFTATANAVLGAYFNLQSFVFMPVFGLNNGMVPIISYNYGARKKDRIVRTIKLSVVFAVSIMIVGMVVMWLFTPQLLSIFNASAEMLEIGVPALRIISLSFVFAGFCICTISVLQAFGHGLKSLAISVIRQLVVLLPSAFLLSRIGGLEVIWWAYPFAECVSVLCCIYFLRSVYIKEVRPLDESPPSLEGAEQP